MYPYPSETAEQPSKQRAQHTGTRTLTLPSVCVLLAALYGVISFDPPAAVPGPRLGVHLEPAR